MQWAWAVLYYHLSSDWLYCMFPHYLTLNIPSLGRQRCLPSWGPRRTPWFFVISQLFDAVDYSNYVFWVSENIIQWFKHCWCGKVISITYSECVSVALFIPHAKRMGRIIWSSVDCSALLYFSALSHKSTMFEKRYWTQNVCFDFLYDFFWNISHSKKKWAWYDKKIHICHLWSTHFFCQIFMKFEFSRQFFEKSWNIRLHERPSSGNRIVLCGQTDRGKDMTKLIVTFRNFETAPAS